MANAVQSATGVVAAFTNGDTQVAKCDLEPNECPKRS